MAHRYRYLARKQAVDSSVRRLLTREVAVPILRGSIYSLFGMGMQRVDAERLECGEPSPL